MSRCGCVASVSETCACSIDESDLATINGSGSVANPFTIEPRIDTADENILSVSSSGLLVTGALGVLDYASVDVNQGSIASSSLIAGLSVSAAIPAGGRWIKVEYNTPGMATTNIGEVWAFEIVEGMTRVAARFEEIGQTNPTIGGAEGGGVLSYITFIASAGTHTYNARLTRSTGSGTGTHVADATALAHIAIIDLGSG